MEDFKSYTNDQQLAKAWYKPPHGGGIRQTRESTLKNSGNFSLKFEYSTTKSDDKFYSSICRVSQWNLAGCNALQFWFKPDGSGRALLFGMNIASREGKNIHDLWEYTYVPKKGDTTPRIVTVPFSKLVKNAKYADSPDTSPVFKPGALIEVGLCIGGRSDEPGEGAYYFDDFKGVWLAQPLGVQAEPGGSPDGADLIDVAVVSDRILRLEFNDGWVKHSGYHERRHRCVVYRWPLDLAAAAQATNYTLSSDTMPTMAGAGTRSDVYFRFERAYVNGDWDEAIAAMQDVARLESDAADPYYYIGESYRFKGQPNDAITAYGLALEKDPEFGPAYVGLARARLQIDPGANALPLLDEAIRFDPNFGEAYLERAKVKLRDNDLQGAIIDLGTADRLLPNSPLVYYTLAQARQKERDYETALVTAQRANELDVTYLPVYLTLGQLYAELDQPEQAVEALGMYLEYNEGCGRVSAAGNDAVRKRRIRGNHPEHDPGDRAGSQPARSLSLSLLCQCGIGQRRSRR